MMPRARVHRARSRRWRTLALVAALAVVLVVLIARRDPVPEEQTHRTTSVLHQHAPNLYELTPGDEEAYWGAVILEGLGVCDLWPLAGQELIEWVSVRHCGVPTLEPLRGLSHLQMLSLQGTSVFDLGPLSELRMLKRLELRGSGVTDLSPIGHLTELRYLDVGDTDVSDLRPLAGLVNLEVLYINGTLVEDLSPVTSLPRLKVVDLAFTRLERDERLDVRYERDEGWIEYVEAIHEHGQRSSLRWVMEQLAASPPWVLRGPGCSERRPCPDHRSYPGYTIVPAPEAAAPGWFEGTFNEHVARAVARPRPGDRPGEPLA
jgi:hypothetical protein